MRAFLGIGSNQGDREASLRLAVRRLPDVVAVSPVYETDPMGGPEGQDAYLNAVVELDTALDPHELLAAARVAEAAAGRVRVERFGPRTLDVDVLLVGGLTVHDADLEVPHPRMGQRRFVLAPLADLAPDLVSAEALVAAEGAVRRTALRLDAPVVRVVGPGRAGTSLTRALAAAGWGVAEPVRRGGDVAGAATRVDLVVVSTPDAAIAEVASAIEPVPGAVVAHLAGSLGLDVLAPHVRRAALHPLVSIPTPTTPLVGAWFAVAGDPLAARVVEALGGRLVAVADVDRARYHAAACIASNHLVALLGQVERVAATAGVPLDAYLDLVRATVDNVARLGPAAALTGPVRRGDTATVERHLAALDPGERAAYVALAEAAGRLVPDEDGAGEGAEAEGGACG